ncbi:MAG: EAL domain-containing protein [Nitriliruptoraceae bacterium]|nr:EAL domain-containing protein [Nitriliruptoraceae bacterium]
MARRDEPGPFDPVLRHGRFSGYWWVVTGLATLAAGSALLQLESADIEALDIAFWVVLGFVILGEIRPVVASKELSPSGVNLATAFHFAVLITWGLPAALIGVLVGSAIGDLVRRKEWYRTLFNLSQYTLGYLSAWVVLAALGWSASPQTPATLQPRDLGLIVIAAVAYHLVNLGLVGTAVGLVSGQSLRQSVFGDFWWHTSTTLGVMALSPLVVVVIATSWGFLPLLLLPLALVWATAQLALDREHRGLRDELTSLANRASIADLVAQRSQQAEPPRAALCLLDLDRFKEVNDTLGHSTGDQLLQAVASRLRTACRDDDVVARLGGDEFALLLDIDEVWEAERIVGRITDAIRAPFEVGGILLEVEVSAGIALFPDHGQDLETLLRRADLAMYEAKGSGETLVSFDPELDQRTPGRLALLAELRQGLPRGELFLAYQPQVRASDGRLVGAEALLRWQHPTRGLLLPGAFLPQAEHTAVMREVTAYVLRAVIAHLGVWRDAGLGIPVSMNASLHDLADQRFADLVADSLAQAQVPPDRLCLEITEQALVSDPTRVLLTLERLHGMGVQLSLDDFGTGHASLTRLKQLPVDEVKIDRQFVIDLDAGDAADRAVVRAVIELAHACGLRTIAEGVETEAQRATLAGLGCDVIQGWLIAPALTAEEFASWLEGERTLGPPLPAVPGPTGE